MKILIVTTVILKYLGQNKSFTYTKNNKQQFFGMLEVVKNIFIPANREILKKWINVLQLNL